MKTPIPQRSQHENDDRRVRVLISAFACQPGKGSEEEIGWRWVEAASHAHEVWVLTHSSQRGSIEDYLTDNPNENLHFVFVNFPILDNPPGFAGLIFRCQYMLWQLAAYKHGRALARVVPFDVTHHITYCSIRYPTLLPFLDIPFVWGPIGGGEQVPREFITSCGWRGAILESLRRLSNWYTKVDPLVRFATRRSARIIAANQATLNCLSKDARSKTVIRQNTGVEAEWERSAARDESDTLRLIFVGRLEHIKGVQYLAPVVSALRERGVEVQMTVVGDGTLRTTIEEQSKSLGVEDSISLIGRVPREQIPDLLSEHDMFLFPSLRDSGGSAVVEAMMAGLPVVCVGIGGPAEAVNMETGRVVQPRGASRLVDDLASEVYNLARSSTLRQSLGNNGRERALRKYEWSSLTPFVESLYQSALRTQEYQEDGSLAAATRISAQ